MNHSFDREISFAPRTSDFCYDVFVHGAWVASARYQGAGDLIADEICQAQDWFRTHWCARMRPLLQRADAGIARCYRDA